MSALGLGVHGVVVRYPGADRPAVDGVDLRVAPGEVLALLGPSGCGKSSLLRAVAGLEPLAGGDVTWDGESVARVPVHRRRFGLLFQDGQLFVHRDVAGNVEYGLRAAGWPRDRRAARVAELLDQVGLAGWEHRDVATLSGGERQRVALARALAPGPRLLLLDEPLSALDRALREHLAAEVRETLVRTATTAVFVTHDQDEAFVVADRVAVMSQGRILQVDAPERLWRGPASREVAEFLGYQAFLPVDDAWSRRGAPDLAGADRLLAVGPEGFIVLGAGGPPEAAVGPEAAVEPAPTLGCWQATVQSTTVRRGRLEVAAVADLPDGPTRVVALASTAPRPGDRVRLGVDRRAAAWVPVSPAAGATHPTRPRAGTPGRR